MKIRYFGVKYSMRGISLLFSCLGLFIWSLAAPPVYGATTLFSYPLRDGTYPTTYFDHSGKDWNCGNFVYGGHVGSDFGIGGFGEMDKGYNINQIADKMGYKNTESFIRQFEKLTRLTPTQFRKKRRAHNEEDK